MCALWMCNRRSVAMLAREEAIKKLERQLSALPEVKSQGRNSLAYTKWRRDTEVALEQSFGAGTRHLKDFKNTLDAYAHNQDDGKEEFDRAFLGRLDKAAMVLQSMIAELSEYGNSAPSELAPGPLKTVERICVRFHQVALQLLQRRKSRPTLKVKDEYDAQDLLHALLRLEFDDIRPEVWIPSYAGAAARMDFLLKPEQLVIEVKKTRKGLGPKELGEQLLVDIAKYRENADCKILVCFVYDPDDRIPNPRGIESDLERSPGPPAVRAIIAPRS